MDDRLLVRALRSRDPGALGDVYDVYAERLYRYCWFRLRCRDTAQVALRDTFIVAEAHIDELRDYRDFASWLYTIARMECTRRLPLPGPGPDVQVASHDQEDVDQRMLAWRSVTGLDPLSRDEPPDSLRWRVLGCFSDPELVSYRLFVATRQRNWQADGFPEPPRLRLGRPAPDAGETATGHARHTVKALIVVTAVILGLGAAGAGAQRLASDQPQGVRISASGDRQPSASPQPPVSTPAVISRAAAGGLTVTWRERPLSSPPSSGPRPGPPGHRPRPSPPGRWSPPASPSPAVRRSPAAAPDPAPVPPVKQAHSPAVQRPASRSATAKG